MSSRLRTRLEDGRQAGFTLIELLIVIVILGILAAIVVFAVGSARDDSVKASCKADVKTINTAEEAYKAKTGSYTTIALLASGGYIKQQPPTTEYSVTWNGSSASGTVN